MRLLFTLLSILLIGCSSLSAGKIINEKFVPAHTESYESYEYWYEDCHYDFSDKRTVCESKYHFVTRYRDEPDRWYVMIEGDCHFTDKGNECQTAWKEVYEETYNQAKAGELDWYGPTPTP